MTLDQLAIRYGTDKSSKHHNYCHRYEYHFAPIKDKQLTFFNIGFGGYEFPDRGGGDSLMWADFFPNATIIVTDIHDKKPLKNNRVNFRRGSQDDQDFWENVCTEFGTPDIIIDDASHVNPLTLRTFEILFPKLKSGGFYVIEDIETSWGDAEWCKGNSDPLNFTHPSPINLARLLLNEVNKKYVTKYESKYPLQAMHFYENLIIMQKA